MTATPRPPPSPLDVEAIRVALEKMTPGPWRAHAVEGDKEHGQRLYPIILKGDGGRFIARSHGSRDQRHEQERADIYGIVEIVNNAPTLLARLDEMARERDAVKAMLAIVATKSSLLCAWHAHYGAFDKNSHVRHPDLCACDVEVKKLRAHAVRDALLAPPAVSPHAAVEREGEKGRG